MSAENKAIARRLIQEAFNEGKLEVIDELAAPGIVSYDSALPEPLVGIDATKASITAYREAFPDLAMAVEEQIAEGDLVVTRWTARGTHQGELMGMAPTGKEATVTGITIDRLENGRIVESRTNWDSLGLMQQLGAVPALAMA
jgi:steroid delta-isomerase-like uncharacterized protein